ncbi:splicing factor Spf30 [Purpureocillium lavendulum]|uniref:Splicing factor Spf30 n=1 Tax=Purpureocillium lavendulum TaxID=1247861 RepID=A0AB34FKR8_9HYPO|nr:splicing factor Spf30 [Purpureocillium lavendulum]
MSSIAEIEVEKKQYQEQLDIVRGQLRDDPDNAELKALEGELNDVVALLNESMTELQPARPKSPETTAAAEQPPPEKWSRENHPAYKKATPVAEEKDDAPVNYQVNDNVLAKWVSGDRAFYPAKITSITGSSTAPIYIVKFKSYDTTETLRSKDLRPISNKRKAEGPPATTASPTPASASAPGLVSSADATVYPQANKDNQNEGEAAKPPKPKKIKAKKELEASKNKWQEFNAKSKFGKTKKKDSMFRTPDGIHGRVGFTGSGQAMRKDPARVRPHYDENQEVD